MLDFIVYNLASGLPMSVLSLVSIFFRHDKNKAILSGIAGGISLPVLGFFLTPEFARMETLVFSGVWGAGCGYIVHFISKAISRG